MKRAGFVIMDIVIGLMIVSVLVVALTVTISQQRRATARLGHAREARRLAERALVELQGGVQPTIADGRTHLAVEPLTVQGTPAGWRWVRLVVTHRGGTGQLIGLVPGGKVQR